MPPRSTPAVLVALTLAACAAAAPPPPKARPARCPAVARSGFTSPFSYEQMILAERHAARGEWTAAVAGYRNTLATGEEDAYVMARLAEALEASGDRAGADSTLAEALALDACSEAAWLARARIARGRGGLEAAIHAYEQAASIPAASPRARFELAALLSHTGKHERARALLAALARDRRVDVHNALRAQLELALSTRDPEALARASEDWLALGARDAAFNRRAAHALLHAGRPVLALRMLASVSLARQDAPLRVEVLQTLGREAEVELLRATVPADWLDRTFANAELYERLQRAALPALAAELRSSTLAPP